MLPFTVYSKFISVFSFFILTVIPVTAQYNEEDFVSYTVKEGLSHNYVTSIQQDDRGYIWAGTDLGLNCFDGNSFTNYYQGTKPLFLPSGIIRNLKNMGSHRLGV
ncbi:MAG: two-component regulator propeller domain-containing protein, partial [Chitinophagaceae bacterium]